MKNIYYVLMNNNFINISSYNILAEDLWNFTKYPTLKKTS